MMAIGTHAIAGMGRMTSDTGSTSSRNTWKRPISMPSGTAVRVARQKPQAMRRQLMTMFMPKSALCSAREALASTSVGDGTLTKRT